MSITSPSLEKQGGSGEKNPYPGPEGLYSAPEGALDLRNFLL